LNAAGVEGWGIGKKEKDGQDMLLSTTNAAQIYVTIDFHLL
jgi:hypothetical protein